MTAPRGASLARAALLVQTLLSAGTFLVTKDALGTPDRPGPLAPGALFALRFAVVLLVLLAMVAATPAAYRLPRERRLTVLALGFIAVPVNVGCFFEGAARAPASHAALGYALTPAFVFLIERFRGRAEGGPIRIAGLALSLAGVLVMVARRGALSGPEPLGDLLLLAAAASWALYTVMSRPLVAEIGSRPAMVLSLLAGSILALPASIPILLGLDLRAVPLHAWADVGYVAIVTTVIAYSLWLYALRRLDPTQVAVFTNLQPVATAALSLWLLREPLTPAFVVATTLVLAGVTLVQRAPAGAAARSAA